MGEGSGGRKRTEGEEGRGAQGAQGMQGRGAGRRAAHILAFIRDVLLSVVRHPTGRAQEAHWKLIMQGSRCDAHMCKMHNSCHPRGVCMGLRAAQAAWLPLLLPRTPLIPTLPTPHSLPHRYADRLPIGLESVIRGVSADTVGEGLARLAMSMCACFARHDEDVLPLAHSRTYWSCVCLHSGWLVAGQRC